MGIFGPSQSEVWSEFASEIEAEYIKGRVFQADKIISKFENWTVTIDTYSQSSGNSTATYTRFRSPYKELENMDFKIYKSGIFSGIGKALKMQDVLTGDNDFDQKFTVKGNNEGKLKELLELDKIRQMIKAEDKIRVETKRGRSPFSSKLPQDVNQLYFLENGLIKDKERLTNIYTLIVFMLKQLTKIGIASEEDPKVELK